MVKKNQLKKNRTYKLTDEAAIDMLEWLAEDTRKRTGTAYKGAEVEVAIREAYNRRKNDGQTN